MFWRSRTRSLSTESIKWLQSKEKLIHTNQTTPCQKHFSLSISAWQTIKQRSKTPSWPGENLRRNWRKKKRCEASARHELRSLLEWSLKTTIRRCHEQNECWNMIRCASLTHKYLQQCLLANCLSDRQSDSLMLHVTQTMKCLTKHKRSQSLLKTVSSTRWRSPEMHYCPKYWRCCRSVFRFLKKCTDTTMTR